VKGFAEIASAHQRVKLAAARDFLGY